MAKWNYDATDVKVIADNEPMYGYQPGDMVSGERANNSEDYDVDAQGWGVFSTNNDIHGTITINLSAGSPANLKLMALANAHKEFTLSVTTPHERVYSNQAKIQKVPSFGAGTKTGVKAWVILCIDYNDEMNE
ncbi:hypothetical protein [Levilactobacillus brevis]|jgi:hypothetical protein|uniref:hypothetical protein n=1 Tax=Levilactobacillus brevis TaxID=1580 RepID=UPI000A201D89|nr:hypothetical protein [Levilactobacillus brevis]TYA97303.1 hypothetical protein FXE12_11130 [Lactobacillus sp. SL9-6]ARN89820.1 hypothetical protein AZI09_04500 [Levilactobacillus brevis]ARN97404.1 hypothetical protein AZI10_04485 [Levilactobacillus brevis]ARN97457.1 hypothetical protein AZI10_04825 [Levilactobacillus brevis]ARQ94271.1 hypothetical protein A6F60_11435 [Levilactobacillus brevis]